LNILELKAKCRRLKQQHDIKMVIIDYLQLMTVKSDARVGTREQEIGLISRSLKSLAKELNIPVIALSQLNRNVDKNNDKIPQLSDLRDSGSIEQDADQVFFIYRPAYYKIFQDEMGNDISDLAQIVIAKNRHGDTSTVDLRYVGEFVRFENRSNFNQGNANPFSTLKQNSDFDAQFETHNIITKPSKMNEDHFFTDQGPSIDEPDF
jgi:replicative DNA helicase